MSVKYIKENASRRRVVRDTVNTFINTQSSLASSSIHHQVFLISKDQSCLYLRSLLFLLWVVAQPGLMQLVSWLERVLTLSFWRPISSQGTLACLE